MAVDIRPFELKFYFHDVTIDHFTTLGYYVQTLGYSKGWKDIKFGIKITQRGFQIMRTERYRIIRR